MQNKVYYHGIKPHTTNDLLLAKSYKPIIFKIYDENIGTSLIILSTNHYEVYGDVNSNDFKFYYDSTKAEYYIVLAHGGNTTHYVSFINELPPSNGVGLHSGKAETIDVSSLTLLEKSNKLNFPIQRIQTTQITGGETYSYTSKNLNQVYNAYGSILLVTARRSTGVNASGVYLLHKDNENATTNTYTVTPIVENNVSNTFTITGTTTGVDLLSAGNCVYKIIEVFNGLPLE